MTEVNLRKLNTHYFLSQAEGAAQRKLDRLHLKVLDDAFASAIERAGIPEDGELCLRSISAPVRLRLNSPDHSITAHWTSELAQNLADAIRNGPRSRRVFYYSRRQAVFDFALCVSRGEYERAWAWRLLGLWQGSEPVDGFNALRQLVEALVRGPNLIVPSFRYLAALGQLPLLSRRLSPLQWQELSEAALIGASAVLTDISAAPPSSRVFNYALRVLKRSQLLAGINYSATLEGADETTRRAIAALAVVDAEPALVHSQVAASVVALVATSIGRDNVETAPPKERRISDKACPQKPSLEINETTQVTLRPLDRSESDWHDAAIDTPPGFAGTDEVEYSTRVLDPRQRAKTDYGGLLFLIAVIDLLELPEKILADPVLGTRALCWTLHQLAMVLAPVGPTDPAALAFAGLAPDAPPPPVHEPPATESETTAVAGLAARIVEYLSSLVINEPDPPETLLDFVCRRRAEIVADPVWIEIRFSLDQASTEIRRAGLDLDPGYVVWLGVVMKFVYE